MSDIPAAAAVVPRAELSFFQQAAGEIFCRKDQVHIGKSPNPKGFSPKKPAEGSKDSGAAVYGKHPDRGFSPQSHIAPAEGIQGGKQNFHTPAGKSAFYKIVKKNQQSFSHTFTPFRNFVCFGICDIWTQISG